MCEKVFCEVCGALGWNEKRVETLRVILCSKHHNELHLRLHEGEARVALRTLFITRRKFHVEGREEQFENWINAEDRLLGIAEGIFGEMKKEWEKKNKKKRKKTPRPKPSDDGELAE